MPLNPPAAWNVNHYVYILANKSRTTLYIGVTNSLERRITQHRDGESSSSFTARYNLNRLVLYERFADIRKAIAREKQLKNWSRKKKDQLIARRNPRWEDLFVTELGFDPPKDVPFRDGDIKGNSETVEPH